MTLCSRAFILARKTARPKAANVQRMFLSSFLQRMSSRCCHAGCANVHEPVRADADGVDAAVAIGGVGVCCCLLL